MSDFTIITRAQWGARSPKTTPVHVAPADRRYFVLHHSGGPVTQTVRAIQDWCMDGRGFNDIDYNFLVRGDTGEIYQGRGWDVQGAHTVGYNVTGAGVCIIGTDQASDAAKRSVRWLYGAYNTRCGRALIPQGHRDLDPPRDCPGDRNEAWLKAGMPTPIQEAPVTQVSIDDDSVQRIVSRIGRDLVTDASGIAIGTRRQVQATVADEFAALPGAVAREVASVLVPQLSAAILAGLPTGSVLTAGDIEQAVRNVIGQTRLSLS